MCDDSDNNWFLTHNFTKLSLHDLQRENDINYENVRDSEIFEILDDYKLGGIYNFDTEEYVKSKWILADEINGEIPGFILIKCDGGMGEEFQSFTHEIYFAFVRKQYRQRGVLKTMISKIPKEWKIWLESCPGETDNIDQIWNQCGFSLYCKIGNHRIFSTLISKFD